MDRKEFTVSDSDRFIMEWQEGNGPDGTVEQALAEGTLRMYVDAYGHIHQWMNVPEAIRPAVEALAARIRAEQARDAAAVENGRLKVIVRRVVRRNAGHVAVPIATFDGSQLARKARLVLWASVAGCAATLMLWLAGCK